MDKAIYIVKKLIKLLQQLNKLAIEIISLLGWLIILTELLEQREGAEKAPFLKRIAHYITEKGKNQDEKRNFFADLRNF